MFIWRWQHIFQNVVERLLKNIFQILELPTVSNIFVLAIPISTENVAKICFEPEDCGFMPHNFKQVFNLSKEHFDNDPEQLFFRGSPHLNQAHKDSLYPKALRKAVQSILNQHDLEQKQVSFCSFPVQKNEHWVMTVVQLNQQCFDSQYCLTKEMHEIHSMRKYRIDRCFLEAVIYQILEESELELQRPSAGNTSLIANPERVIEDAASNFLKSIEVHVNQWNKVDLLSFANAIAAERYEGTIGKGRLIVCQTNHPDISAKVKLKVPIEIYNYRGIRKLLEVSSNQMALLCDGESVWGFGVPLDTYQPSLENLFEIRFVEHHTWELVHAENIMLRVKYRQPRLPRPRFDREVFNEQLERLFQVSRTTASILVEAVEAAVEQRHGTMLMITTEAKQETARLAAQSTPIEPIMASRKIISHISNVDGAILISPDGIVHSFGVILDGQASKNGNSSRGARYNSAIRYVDAEKSRNIDCLALIVSEDGYVDIYPSMKAQSPIIYGLNSY
ncbi:MAG TPA: DNA integrity scanning protein DisA nucleotide-binding domain protein [Coleofasciculaceae cyanobacterium]|jgi:DNA integrity scanning protein DisA with diadenylate cyclase activity